MATRVNKPAKATEAEMVELLRDRYCRDAGNGPSAVLIPQVRDAAGFDATRTADALVMGLWPSRGLHLEGFEIKCSRADVLKELRQPEKAERIARFCDKWWLVLSSASFIKDGELPDEWGLLVAGATGKLAVAKAAPVRNVPDTLPKSFLAALLRQADRESLRPGRDALRAEYDRGVAAGESSARYKLERAEQLAERVRTFEALSGVSIEHGYRVEAHAAAVRLVIGNGWDGLATRLDGLATSAADIVARIRATNPDPETD